jgi:hypothetical protein
MILQCAADDGYMQIHIDSISTAEIIHSEVWNNKNIVAIDELGSEFLEYVLR